MILKKRLASLGVCQKRQLFCLTGEQNRLLNEFAQSSAGTRFDGSAAMTRCVFKVQRAGIVPCKCCKLNVASRLGCQARTLHTVRELRDDLKLPATAPAFLPSDFFMSNFEQINATILSHFVHASRLPLANDQAAWNAYISYVEELNEQKEFVLALELAQCVFSKSLSVPIEVISLFFASLSKTNVLSWQMKAHIAFGLYDRYQSSPVLYTHSKIPRMLVSVVNDSVSRFRLGQVFQEQIAVISKPDKIFILENLIRYHLVANELELAIFYFSLANKLELKFSYHLYEQIIMSFTASGDTALSLAILQQLHFLEENMVQYTELYRADEGKDGEYGVETPYAIFSRTWSIFIQQALQQKDYKAVKWVWRNAVEGEKVVLSDYELKAILNLAVEHSDIDLAKAVLTRKQRRHEYRIIEEDKEVLFGDRVQDVLAIARILVSTHHYEEGLRMVCRLATSSTIEFQFLQKKSKWLFTALEHPECLSSSLKLLEKMTGDGSADYHPPRALLFNLIVSTLIKRNDVASSLDLLQNMLLRSFCGNKDSFALFRDLVLDDALLQTQIERWNDHV